MELINFFFKWHCFCKITFSRLAADGNLLQPTVCEQNWPFWSHVTFLKIKNSYLGARARVGVGAWVRACRGVGVGVVGCAGARVCGRKGVSVCGFILFS